MKCSQHRVKSSGLCLAGKQIGGAKVSPGIKSLLFNTRSQSAALWKVPPGKSGPSRARGTAATPWGHPTPGTSQTKREKPAWDRPCVGHLPTGSGGVNKGEDLICMEHQVGNSRIEVSMMARATKDQIRDILGYLGGT